MTAGLPDTRGDGSRLRVPAFPGSPRKVAAMTSNSNVVPLGDHPRARSRLSAQESSRVLTSCRDLALERITCALAGMLDKVEDELFDLAEQAHDRGAQNLYLDARANARGKRHLIEVSFRQHFVALFDRKVRGEA